MRKTGSCGRVGQSLLLWLLATALHAGAWGDVFETAHFRHIAGGGLGDGGSALAASLLPRDIAAGPDGTLYIADEQSNRIRAISPDGTITTIVGSGRYGGDEGAIAPADASFSIPNSLASAPHSGALYIVDLGNRQVRRLANGFLEPFVTPDHPVFATVAGTFAPAAIAIGPEGKIHIADRGTNVVWQFDPDGGGRRAAGNGTRGYAGDGGPSALGQLANPVSVDVGEDGSIYVADRGNRRVRKVEDGQLSTIAGNGGLATAWEVAASALSVSLDPIDLAAAPGGDLFILDALGNRLIRLSDNRLQVVCSFSEEAEPRAISIMPDGRVLVAEYGGGQVTILDPDPTAFEAAQPLAGNGLIRASGDGDAALNASLYQPFGLATDGEGTIYFADRLNHLVRRITPNGTIEIVAGTGEAGYGGDGGPPKEALFDHPTGLAIDVDGGVWVADEGNHRIRRIDLNEDTIETVAGSGVAEFSGDFGSALAAGLRLPSGIAFDSRGRLIVADAGNRRVRRVEADGTMVTIAGNGETFPATGGLALESALLRPVDVTRDDRGGLLITDAEGHRVYRLHDGLLLPVAGTANGEGEGIDGTLATLAALRSPLGAAPDGAGGTFIADTGNGRIGHVNGSGIFRTIASNALQPARILFLEEALLISDIVTHRISEQSLTRIVTRSEPQFAAAARDHSIATIAAFSGITTGITYDPVADRLYLSHAGGLDEIARDGERVPFAEFTGSIAAVAPITGAYDRGLVVASPTSANGSPLTVVERHWKGWLRTLPIERPLDGLLSIALSPSGDLFAYSLGRLIRFRGSTWPVAPILWAGPDGGFAPVAADGSGADVVGFLGEELTTSGSRFLTAADVLRQVALEEVASLPEETAFLAITEGGILYVALAQSQQLLALRRSSSLGGGEIEVAARLENAPVSITAAEDDLFVATSAGAIYRYSSGAGGLSLFASGFAPAIISISANRSGLLYVLEGDESDSRLLALSLASRSLEIWPGVVDLGPQPLDVAVRRTVALRNDGAVSMTIAPELPPGTIMSSGGGLIDLEPGELVEVGVETVPGVRGRMRSDIVWRDATADEVLGRTSIAVIGLAPRLDVVESLELETTWVGGRSVRTLSLTNHGDWRLDLSQLAVSGFDPEELSVELPPSGSIVEPGETTDVAIAFSPRERRRYEGVVAIHTNDPEQPVRHVAVFGAGGRAELLVPTMYEMGVATIGERSQLRWELTNTGELPVEINQILTGERRVRISPRRLTIRPGESGLFDVLFTPDEMRLYEGTFRFSTNDPLNRELLVPFTGRAVSSLVNLSADSHEFATTALGARRHWELNVTNLSRRTIAIINVSSNSRQFRVVGRPSRLEPGESGSIGIDYLPSKPGTVKAKLRIETDLGEARTIEIPLSGRTASASRLTLSLPSDGGPLERWPGEEVALSLSVEGAVRLKGMALELSGPFDTLEFAGLDYPPGGLLSGAGQPLTVTDLSEAGKLQIGISLTGRRAADGINGDGLLAMLRFRVRPPLHSESGHSGSGRRITIDKAALHSALGGEEVLTSATELGAAEFNVVLKGDFDADGELSLSDFFILADKLGAVTKSPGGRRLDLTGDGLVNRDDVELLKQHLEPDRP